MPNAKFSSTTTGANNVSTASEIFIEDMPPRELMVVLDKVFAGNDTVVQPDGTIATRFEAFDNYEAALSTPGVDFEAKSLDLENFDIRSPGDLVQLVRDLIEDASVKMETAKDASGKRQFKVLVDIAGKRFEFDADDLEGLGDALGATGLDLDEISGAEQVADNQDAPIHRPSRLIRKFRATNDGDDDALRSDNSNILTQTKAGFIVTSVLDINLNAGLNGTLAIFIA